MNGFRFPGILTPDPNMTLASSDILFYGDDGDNDIPNTLQVGCSMQKFFNYAKLHRIN